MSGNNLVRESRGITSSGKLSIANLHLRQNHTLVFSGIISNMVVLMVHVYCVVQCIIMLVFVKSLTTF